MLLGATSMVGVAIGSDSIMGVVCGLTEAVIAAIARLHVAVVVRSLFDNCMVKAQYSRPVSSHSVS